MKKVLALSLLFQRFLAVKDSKETVITDMLIHSLLSKACLIPVILGNMACNLIRGKLPSVYQSKLIACIIEQPIIAAIFAHPHFITLDVQSPKMMIYLTYTISLIEECYFICHTSPFKDYAVNGLWVQAFHEFANIINELEFVPLKPDNAMCKVPVTPVSYYPKVKEPYTSIILLAYSLTLSAP